MKTLYDTILGLKSQPTIFTSKMILGSKRRMENNINIQYILCIIFLK